MKTVIKSGRQSTNYTHTHTQPQVNVLLLTCIQILNFTTGKAPETDIMMGSIKGKKNNIEWGKSPIPTTTSGTTTTNAIRSLTHICILMSA